jgi:hypothetical protein
MHFASLVGLGMRSEGNVPKSGEPAVGFSSTAVFQHTGQYGRLSIQPCDNTVAFPYSSEPAAAELYLFHRLK